MSQFWIVLRLLLICAAAFVVLKFLRDRMYAPKKPDLTIVELIVMLGITLVIALGVSTLIRMRFG